MKQLNNEQEQYETHTQNLSVRFTLWKNKFINKISVYFVGIFWFMLVYYPTRLDARPRKKHVILLFPASLGNYYVHEMFILSYFIDIIK